MSVDVTLRPVMLPADEPFLRAVFAGTREVELAHLPAEPPGLRETFLNQQYAARAASYATQQPGCDGAIVLAGGEPVGAVTVDRTGERWCIVDLAVLPESRGRGVGSAVLRQLLNEAAAQRRAVELQVTPWNPALRLYERFGFVPEGTDPMAQRMLWNPPQ